jgi:pimeloyl-ACP methyl ester carboxylesterase
VVVLLHGFGEDSAGMLGRARAVVAMGCHALVPDGRGRGASAGAWVSHGGREAADVHVWLDAARRLCGGHPVRAVLWGRSMGAAIAMRAAADPARRDIAGLVLEAPYADLRTTLAGLLRRRRLPGWLARGMLARAAWLAGVSLDAPSPVTLAPEIHQPTLILGGLDDRVTPPDQTRRLPAAFVRVPTLLEVPGGRHADVFERGGDPVEQALRGLIAASCGPAA